MRRNLRSALSGRGFLLLPAAAFAVHQLRYEFAYGSGAGQALSAQGHAYLSSLAPWAVLLLACALGALLVRIARAAVGDGDGGSPRSFAALWALTSLSLTAIYAAQETLEGLYASGHPGGLVGIYGHGGWWSLVLAAVGGLVVASLLRLAVTIVAVVARAAASPAALRTRFTRRRPASQLPGRTTPLAGSAAGRAPPAAVCAA